MKAKDIFQYESTNENTILIIVNKSVCRAFEVSAFWLNKCTSIEKLHSKYSRSLSSHMIYAWFSTRRFGKILKDLQAQGFRSVANNSSYIILKKEGAKLEGYDEWKEKVFDEAMVEKHLQRMVVW